MGGTGGLGGAGGSPPDSRLLRVNPQSVAPGNSVSIEALCKWDFGCRLYVGETLIAELVSSAGFQEFTHTFNEEGEFTVQLFQKGTVETLIAEKTVTVRSQQATEPEEEDEGQPFQGTSGPLQDQGQQDEDEDEEETPPTGLFGLGELDLESLAPGAIIIIIIVAGIIYFFVINK